MIEMVVIVGVMGVIMIAIVSIMINSFRAKNRIEVADVVETSGTTVYRQLKDNLITATAVGMTCATDASQVGSTLAVMNINDGVVTNLVCYEGSRIASESANGVFRLTDESVGVSGCDNFARCELFPDSTDRVTKVNFLFNLSSGTTSVQAEKSKTRQFRFEVVPRN